MKEILNFTKVLSFVFLLIFAISCNKDDGSAEKLRQEAEALDAYLIDNNITTEPQPSGLYYIETLAGAGNAPTYGQQVYVHYTGKLLNGSVFDSSQGKLPFDFPLGLGYVIAGWDEGIALMKEGGKATLIIPSTLGYGSSGKGSIPPYSTLVFDVELVDIGM